MLYDNIKKLIAGIVIVSILLFCCIAVDSADETITIDNSDVQQNITINDSYVLNKTAGKAVTDGKIYVDKTVQPTIGMWAKPSVRSRYAYKWYYRTWVNYCPNCKHYNCLLKNPKHVPEKEYTCKICDSDFCGVTGKEKYSWSHVYLRPA